LIPGEFGNGFAGKHFQEWTAEPQISPLRFAPVEMNKGSDALPEDRSLGENCRSPTTLLRSSGREDKERVVAYLGSCDWDVWISAGRVA
jgi:hypothetical protein